MTPTSTDIKVGVHAKLPNKAAAVAVMAGEDKLLGDVSLPDDLAAAAETLMADGGFRGKAGDVATRMVDGTRLLILGVGDGRKVDALRHAGATLARQAKKYKLDHVAVMPPAMARGSDGDAITTDPTTASAVEAVVTGFCLGAFDFREYRGPAAKQKTADALGKVKLTVVTDDKDAKDVAARAEAVAFGQNFARTIASRPGNDINPPSLAKVAEELADDVGLTCRVMDEKDLKKLGMGGLLAVGAGSGTPPRLICLEHGLPKGKKKSKQKPLLIVGKAITFDTGGISIKPAANMGGMIFDKCGGMAVLGAMAAVAKLKLDRPVVGLLAAAENMPSATAYRPGDILRMYNGVTVEVTNTDAEGRLVLADALSWGIETYEPSACIDLATLTGACVVALGNQRAGAWSNDDALWQTLSESSATVGEKLWRMPLGEEYREMLQATSADIVNAPGRWGGCDTAAEFLHHFIPGNLDGEAEVPWCHLDIAGVADTDKELPLYAKGATGFGVRTLVEWATAR